MQQRINQKSCLVIFDCDGVLIDSEPIVNQIVAEEISHLGWHMTPEECTAQFIGMSLDAVVLEIEKKIGRSLPPSWQKLIEKKVIETLRIDSPLIPGIRDALNGINALSVPWRVASNSSHEEMAVKFHASGLMHLTAGRIHSYLDVPCGKPAPDLFLAAAQAEGVDPANCLVIEDSVAGVTGAVAAGMKCFGYCASGAGDSLIAAGATLFTDMLMLPDLVQEWLEA